MKTMNFLKIAASSLILGAGLGAAVNAKQEAATASSANAARDARKASDFLDKAKFDKAIAFGERAVAGMPGNPQFRAILGQAYLGAGRFLSAEAMLRDAVMLDPSNGKTALNLALAQIALAKNSVALGTLENAKGSLAASDYGLALALAGDLEAAKMVLETAARGVDADAKVRQNLALTYGLSGRWAEARVMAMQDLASDQVNQRLGEWAMFARPSASWDQVASLLGVTPAYDPGMPVQLAFNAAPAPAIPAAQPVVEQVQAAVAPVAEPVVEAVQAAVAPVEAVVEAVQVALAPEPPVTPATVFAPRSPVVQALPVPVGNVSASSKAVFELPTDAPVAKPAFVAAAVAEPALIRAEASPIRQAVVPASGKLGPVALMKDHGVETGRFAVQLGAFSNQARAKLAWKGAVSRSRELANYSVGTPRVTVKGTELYRLSVSGFSSLDSAKQVCARVRSAGGQCFVRSIGQGNPMQYARKRTPVRIASR